MNGLLFYLGAFAVALGALIVVHELGHYAVARWCGVRVLRFSVGFGRALWSRRGRNGTEWAIGVFPLGGYVKMLDEREGSVAETDLPYAFNRKTVWQRMAIVAAGPAANLLLATLIYWGLFMHGSEELRAYVGQPAPASIAAMAGFGDGERVRRVGEEPVETWSDLRWQLARIALERGVARVETINSRQEINWRRLDFSALPEHLPEEALIEASGIHPYRPKIEPVLGRIVAHGAAESAGLREGDLILAIDGRDIAAWSEVVESVRSAPGRGLRFTVLRAGERLEMDVTPDAVEDGGRRFGRIGAMVHDGSEWMHKLTVTVSYDIWPALTRAVGQTWENSLFSLGMFGKMVLGEVSWRNLSGPVTIADYAGQSARMGLPSYLKFIALVSISLGVLNLLPIPLLDGGHLLYYMAELMKGGPVSERVMEIGQQIGLVLLIMLMAFAFYNDINRLLSG